jgi:hypothetical protein
MQGGKKLDFYERDECKPVLLGLSLAGNLVKPPLSLYGTEWRDRGYRLSTVSINSKCCVIYLSLWVAAGRKNKLATLLNLLSLCM